MRDILYYVRHFVVSLIIALAVGLVTLNFHLFLALNGSATGVIADIMYATAAGSIGIATYLALRDAYIRVARRFGIRVVDGE